MNARWNCRDLIRRDTACASSGTRIIACNRAILERFLQNMIGREPARGSQPALCFGGLLRARDRPSPDVLCIAVRSIITSGLTSEPTCCLDFGKLHQLNPIMQFISRAIVVFYFLPSQSETVLDPNSGAPNRNPGRSPLRLIGRLTERTSGRSGSVWIIPSASACGWVSASGTV